MDAILPERVLVLGDGVCAFLAVARSLGRRGVEVHAAPGDIDSPGLKSRYVSAVHRLPAYALAPSKWEEALARLVETERIGLVIPVTDSWILRLDRYAARFGRDRLALPSAESLAVLSDKARTRDLAGSVGVPVAEGRLVSRQDDAAALVARYGLPLALKPRTSHVVGDAREKLSVRIVRTETALAELLASGAADDAVLEAFFEGEGVGVSVLASHGEIALAYQHRRLEEAFEAGASTSRISEAVDPILLTSVEKLVRAAALHGVAMFEFRCDRAAGAYVLLEVNPRFWGSLPLALAAGADFPAGLCALLGGHAVRRSTYRTGIRMGDLTGEYYRRLREADSVPFGRALKLRLTALAAALGLEGREFWDSWAADDPEPYHVERHELLLSLRDSAADRLSRLRRAGNPRPRPALGKGTG